MRIYTIELQHRVKLQFFLHFFTLKFVINSYLQFVCQLEQVHFLT